MLQTWKICSGDTLSTCTFESLLFSRGACALCGTENALSWKYGRTLGPLFSTSTIHWPLRFWPVFRNWLAMPTCPILGARRRSFARRRLRIGVWGRRQRLSIRQREGRNWEAEKEAETKARASHARERISTPRQNAGALARWNGAKFAVRELVEWRRIRKAHRCERVLAYAPILALCANVSSSPILLRSFACGSMRRAYHLHYLSGEEYETRFFPQYTSQIYAVVYLSWRKMGHVELHNTIKAGLIQIAGGNALSTVDADTTSLLSQKISGVFNGVCEFLLDSQRRWCSRGRFPPKWTVLNISCLWNNCGTPFATWRFTGSSMFWCLISLPW